MEQNQAPVSVLSQDECERRLASQVLGRVVTHVADVVDIFPVNYVLYDCDIVLRTAEGTKFAEMAIGREVLFEVDHHDESEAWSVIVRGRARILETEAEIVTAETLPLRTMVPTMKRNFVRITPHSISGRAFQLSAEPSREGPQDY